jgi:tetratricopeptide (TPR) repeat protein
MVTETDDLASVKRRPGQRKFLLLVLVAVAVFAAAAVLFHWFPLHRTSESDNGGKLELARLAADKGDREAAVNDYRAAIQGMREGVRRAQARLELAQYLIAGNDLAAAKQELLNAGGEAPDDPDLDISLAELLHRAGDTNDARTYVQKALALRPDDPMALDDAAHLAYESGDYESASGLLARAIHEQPQSGYDIPQWLGDLPYLSRNTQRILELTPSPTLPPDERVARILILRGLAKRRFRDCTLVLAKLGQTPPVLSALKTRWAGDDGTGGADALLKDSSRQDAALQLAFDTEIETDKLCDDASYDDTLIVEMARARRTTPVGAGQ